MWVTLIFCFLHITIKYITFFYVTIFFYITIEYCRCISRVHVDKLHVCQCIRKKIICFLLTRKKYYICVKSAHNVCHIDTLTVRVTRLCHIILTWLFFWYFFDGYIHGTLYYRRGNGDWFSSTEGPFSHTKIWYFFFS